MGARCTPRWRRSRSSPLGSNLISILILNLCQEDEDEDEDEEPVRSEAWPEV